MPTGNSRAPRALDAAGVGLKTTGLEDETRSFETTDEVACSDAVGKSGREDNDVKSNAKKREPAPLDAS